MNEQGEREFIEGLYKSGEDLALGIALSVHATSERAIRAYRRAGFVEEGRLRQACFRNGRYHDELCFAILRREWEQQLQSDDDEAVERDGSPVLEPAAMTMWDMRIGT